jgi:hypothetical protein
MTSLIDKGVLDTEKINIIMDNYANEIERHGDSTFFKVKSVTINPETLALLNTNYVYNTLEDFVPEGQEEDFPELHANLEDLNSMPGVAGVATGVERVENDIEITDEDIEAAFTNIVRDELKSELIALEAANPVSESELNKNEEVSETIKVATEADVVHDLYGVDNDNIEVTLPVETVLINQKIEKNESDDFEWF